MRYFYFAMMVNVFGFAAKATPPFDNIKDLSGPFYKKYSYLSPVMGVDETDLRNLRLQGHYGTQPNSEFPRYDKHQAIRGNNKAYPQDAMAALLQRLFPSPDGITFVANTLQDEKKDLHQWLKPKNIGTFLNIIRNPLDFLGEEAKEKEVLKKIVESLQPEVFEQKTMKRKIDRAQQQGEEFDIYKKLSSFVFAELLLKAVKENYGTKGNSHILDYPPHTLETALLSYMWQKAELKEDLKPYYEALSPDIIDHDKIKTINFGREGSSYTREDYLALKKNVIASPDLLGEISQDSEKLTLLGLGYTYYEDLLPPVIGYTTTFYKKNKEDKGTSFSNCTETLLRNFWNAVLYDRDQNKFNSGLLKNLDEKYGLKPKKAFINYFDQITSRASNITTALAHNAWTQVVSNLNEGTTADPIIYKHGIYEIEANLSNILRLIGKLLNDPEWKPLNQQGLDLEKAITFNLERLCTICSHDDFKLSWQKGDVPNHTLDSPNAKIIFLNNDRPIFEWVIQPGHAYFQKAKEQLALDWRNHLGERMAQENLIREWIPPYRFFDPYTLNNLNKIPLENAISIFAGVLYGGDFDSIAGKIEAISKIMTFKKHFSSDAFDGLIRQWVEPNGDIFDNWRDDYTTWGVLNALASGKNADEIEALNIPVFNRILKDVNDMELWEEGEGSLHKAAFYGYEGVVNLLLQKHADVNIPEQNRGKIPLHLAVEAGHKSIVELLIKGMVNIDKKDKNQNTALGLALIDGNITISEILLSHGADVNAVDIKGDPLLYHAIQRLFYSSNQADKENEKKIVNLLLSSQNIDVNKGNKIRNTPLHLAAQEGEEYLVRLLFEKGAIVDQKNQFLATPLHFAAARGKKNVVDFFLDKSVNIIDAQSKSGNTALHNAVDKGYEDVVQVLLERGANKNLVNGEGKDPLTIAKEKGKEKIIRLLTEKS